MNNTNKKPIKRTFYIGSKPHSLFLNTKQLYDVVWIGTIEKEYDVFPAGLDSISSGKAVIHNMNCWQVLELITKE